MFFNKSKAEQTGTASTKEIAISSIVGKGMKIKGDLYFSGKARLDGEVEGNIKGEHLIIGETGKVLGDFEGATCSCHGQLTGNMKLDELKVLEGCKIEGDVKTVTLFVEPGSSINGRVSVEAKDLRLIKGAAHIKESAPEIKAQKS